MQYILLSIMMVSGNLIAQEADRAKFSIAEILKDEKLTPSTRADRIKSIHHYSDRGKKQVLYEYENLNSLAAAKDTDLLIKPELKRILFKHGLIRQFAHKRNEKPNVEHIEKFMALDKQNQFTSADLQSAIYNENIDAAKVILELSPELLRQKDEKGVTPLLLATTLYQETQEPSEEITGFVQHLLDMGADSTALLTEKMIPVVADIVQKSIVNRQDLITSVAESRKKYKQYEEFKSRAIILPKPREKIMKSVTLQQREELEEKYKASDVVALPIKTILELKDAYQNVETLYPDFLGKDEVCSVCQDSWNEIKKAPVLVCTNKHTVCQGCFNHPSIQRCPKCREQFSDRDEFWKPIQLDFCQTCMQEKDTLGYTFCNDCNQVGMICSGCTATPCCKKPRIALDSNSIDKVSKHNFIYIDYECQKREEDRSIIDKSFEQQKKKIIIDIQEKTDGLRKKLAVVQPQVLQLDEQCRASRSHIDQIKADHVAWVSAANKIIEVFGGYVANYYQSEEQIRQEVMDQEFEKYNDLVKKFKTMAAEEKTLVDKGNELLIKIGPSQIQDVEDTYQARLQKRNNYPIALADQLAKMWERS